VRNPAPWPHSICVSPRVRNASLTTAANAGLSLARALGSFCTVSVLIRYLGLESYGMAVTIAGMAAWLSVVQGGIGQSLKNDIVRNPESGSRLFADAFGTLLAIVLVVGALLTGLALFCPWGLILNDSTNKRTQLVVACLWIVLLTALFSLVRAVYAAQQKEFRLALPMLAGLLLSIGFVLSGVHFGSSMSTVVAASLTANLIGLAIGLLLMPKQIGFVFSFPRKLYRAGLWFFVIEVCTILIFQTDVFLVNLLLGHSQAAIFALHSQLFLYLESGLLLVVSPYWAAFGDAQKSADRAWLKSAINRLSLATAALSLAGVAILMAAGPMLMRRWSGGQVEWNPLLALAIGIGVMVQGVTGVYATALGSLGIAREPARIVLIQAVLNLGVCVYLIRRFGVTGGAIGSLATYTLTSGIYLPLKVRQVIA
jgi:O-antigen/teichoic acid export membrane protein